jgi:hypothetical protein
MSHLYSLHNRREPAKEGTPHYKAFCLRAYLSCIANAAHRKTMTWMLCGQHRLASVRLAYEASPPVPRSERLCRLCLSEVETPEHILFQCREDPDIVELRDDFRRTTAIPFDVSIPAHASAEQARTALESILEQWYAIVPTAAFVHNVFTLCYKKEMYRPRS